MLLRPYQNQAIEAVLEHLREVKSTLVVMATGCGKTQVFGEVARRWPAGRVLVLAHREELIYQARDRIAKITGQLPAVEMAEERADSAGPQVYLSHDDADGWTGQARVVIASVQSLSRPNRLRHYRPEDFGLLVTDEAHHATATTYRKVYDHFQQNPELRMLGVTATPDRADEEALGQVFESVAFQYEINDAIGDGWLVDVDQRSVIVEGLDFSAARTTAGDLNEGDLDAIMRQEKALHGVVHPTIEAAGDRPTLVFAVTVAHAQRMAEIFCRHKEGSAFCLHGATPREERAAFLRRFHRGEFQFLVNVGLFLEGFDEPRVACVAMARPTKSRSLYAQVVGRGTRALPGVVSPFDPRNQEELDLYAELEADDRRERIACSGKPSVLVLDFVGNSGRHKLVSCADILGGNCSDAVIEEARAAAVAKGAKGEPVNMRQELAAAQKRAEEVERQRRKQILARAQYRQQKVDPFDVLDITPTREPGYHKGKPPTDRMKEVLRKAKFENIEEMSFHQAGELIGKIIERRNKGLCTFPQAKILRKHGYDADVSFEEAGRIITALKENNWQRPAS